MTHTLKVLALNGSLKPSPEFSNTEDLIQLVLNYMAAVDGVVIESEVLRLADLNLELGVKAKMGPEDEWPAVSTKMLAADVVLFGTPIWWGGMSSLMQRVMERMDDFDEQYMRQGRNLLYNRVAGIVITGAEDGAQSIMGRLMSSLNFFGFTLPPEAVAYWVGEVGMYDPEDPEVRRRNRTTDMMAQKLATNLAFYAVLLKAWPLEFDAATKEKT